MSFDLFPPEQIVGVFRGFREGGLEFHADATTCVPGLFVAGEARTVAPSTPPTFCLQPILKVVKCLTLPVMCFVTV